jgi:hypothetical protein
MDSSALVEDGAAGIERIVARLEERGVQVPGAYLIQVIGAESFEEFNLRIVTNDDPRDVLYKYVALRRDGLLPWISEDVTMTPVSPGNIEASRVLDYARQIGRLPTRIRGVVWKGLYIEDAIVVRYPLSERAAA